MHWRHMLVDLCICLCVCLSVTWIFQMMLKTKCWQVHYSHSTPIILNLIKKSYISLCFLVILWLAHIEWCCGTFQTSQVDQPACSDYSWLLDSHWKLTHVGAEQQAFNSLKTQICFENCTGFTKFICANLFSSKLWVCRCKVFSVLNM